jgi:hypothetical protein
MDKEANISITYLTHTLDPWHRWTAGKFGQKGISDVTQILDANLAGKESVRGQVAQE